MNILKLAFRRLFRKGEHSLTRIISLTAGLTFGLLLLSEVFYYRSFDGFYPEADRIYAVYELFKPDKLSDKMESYSRVSGAVAPGLKAEVPGIEAATRLNSLGTAVFYSDDLKSYEAQFSLADEHLFEVLPRPVISGNAVEILKTPMTCMVSDKIAADMGGDPVGKIIEMKEFPGKKLTIGGVFKALPENTNYQYDVLISMVSTSQFTWDGTQNWLGNDRYYACVKLAKGVDPKSLEPAVRKMQVKFQDIEKLEQLQGGTVLKFSFEPIKEIQASENGDMIIILGIIALSVLFVSLLNYILLTLSSLVNRAKSSAIHKTCGAKPSQLQNLIFSETAIAFIISLALSAILLIILKPIAEVQLGHKLSSALSTDVILPLSVIVIFLMALVGYVPGKFYARIPVATAFRNYKQKRNSWKLALLSFQFVGASFILTVLLVVALQYQKMRHADHGYRAEQVYFASTSGLSGTKIATLLEKLKSMPELDQVGLGYSLPTEGASGNNILLPGSQKELFNVADFYWIDENYLSILNIPVKEGKTFTQSETVPNDILISEKGARMLILNTGWTDGVIDKQIALSEHGLTTIRGIYPDFVVHSISSPDDRPSVFFYQPQAMMEKRVNDQPSLYFYVLMKAHDHQQGMMKKLTDVFNQELPYRDAVIKSLEQEQLKNYDSEKGFRNAMLAGNFIILLITALGLMGYTSNEAIRRQKELAIRRINGANLSNILQMFIYDLERIAIPAVMVGLTAAWFISKQWMMNFATKIPLHWGLFALSSLFILFMIALLAIINYTRMANANPVEALRYE